MSRLLLILPVYSKYAYARLTALTFFRHSPAESHCYVVDDASPNCQQQNWDHWLTGLPADRVTRLVRETNRGLTAGWNDGLSFAKARQFDTAICGNSDLLFSPHWYDGIDHNLRRGWHLLGPVTNAPGHGNHNRQHVQNFCPGYEPDDSLEAVARTSEYLRTQHGPDEVRKDYCNGFCLVARTATWWAGAFSPETVFNPRYKMVGNEVELQRRWQRAQRKVGFVPTSFVFHYRSVSRGDRFLTPGWFRTSQFHR